MACPYQTKICLLHTQVAMLTASIATIQTQIQEIESVIKSIQCPHSGDSAKGYDSDSEPLSTNRNRVKTRIPKRGKANKFVMISSKLGDAAYDSGYESSE